MIIRMANLIFVRLIDFSFGNQWITEKREKIKDYIPDYIESPTQSEGKPIRDAPILVYNHVSYSDIVYLMHSEFSTSFVAKLDIKAIPFFGTVCTAIQSIYVRRDSQNSKDGVLNAIKERIDQKSKDNRYPMLAIAPEGTTSNGN